MNQVNQNNIQAEIDLYADQEQTFLETFAVVKGKLAAGIPMTTAREEFINSVIADWSDLFGWETAK